MHLQACQSRQNRQRCNVLAAQAHSRDVHTEDLQAAALSSKDGRRDRGR